MISTEKHTYEFPITAETRKEIMVGTRLRVKSMDWFNQNKKRSALAAVVTIGDCVFCGGYWFTEAMSQYCGKVLTVKRILSGSGGRGFEIRLSMEEPHDFKWTMEMFDSIVE